jgi:hypothetical protein
MQWAGALFPWPYHSSMGVLECGWKHLFLAGFWEGEQRRGRREKLRLEGPLRGRKSIKEDSRLGRHDFENLGQEMALTAIAGPSQSPWLRPPIGSRRQAGGPPSDGPPQTRESSPARHDLPQPSRRRQGKTNHASARVRHGFRAQQSLAIPFWNQATPHLRSPCAA